MNDLSDLKEDKNTGKGKGKKGKVQTPRKKGKAPTPGKKEKDNS